VYTNHTDHDLLHLLIQGSEEAFEQIYRRYGESLNRFAYTRTGMKEESEEIVQEVFVTLWQKRHHLRRVTSLNGYLFRAIQNRIISYYRSAKVRQEYANNFALFAITNEDSVHHEVEHAELQAILSNGLKDLPERCQEAFKLSRLHDMPIPEIARRMQISSRTVENYITQALKHLRTYWQKVYNPG